MYMLRIALLSASSAYEWNTSKFDLNMVQVHLFTGAALLPSTAVNITGVLPVTLLWDPELVHVCHICYAMFILRLMCNLCVEPVCD